MTTVSPPAAQGSSRHALVVAGAFEAIAVALWLIPASVHIVSWPADGPRRLALLAPAIDLAWLSAGAFAVGALAILWTSRGGALASGRGRVGGGLARLAASAAPFWLLWMWAVPYLPSLPDRLPLLLVLAGPVRWVIAAVTAIAAAMRAVRPGKGSSGVAIGRRVVFATSLVVYLACGLSSVRTLGLGGDEPHYLVITESLIRDGDLMIENNHQRGDYRSFFGGDLRPDFMQRGKNGAIYSIHAPGLPVLLLPAYAGAGYLGAVAMLALIAALAALAVFDLADALAGRRAAVAAWVAVCLTVPFVPHAWLIYPEMPGALLVAWAALWVWQPAEQPTRTWLWRGMALATLPWLHTKFIVFLGIFGAAFIVRLRRRPGSMAALAAPIAVSVAAWLYSFYVIYGVFDPEAPYGAYSRTSMLTEYIPHGLLGLFFDQKFGLLFYSPIYLTAIPGAWLMFRRRDARFLAIVLLFVTAAFVGSTARLYMFWGGSSAPARFLVPILPCLAPMMALTIVEARSAVTRALLGVWIAIGLGIGVAGMGWPGRLMLFSDPHGRARVLEAIQGASPLALVVPTFTNPDWASQISQLGLWLAAAAAALVVMLLLSRARDSMTASRSAIAPTPLSLAGIGCGTFLIAAAIFTARPPSDVREQTARRGDVDVLWRFDGHRLRTLDYATLGRATPDRLRELTTITSSPPAASGGEGYTAGPFALPPGVYEAVIWFKSSHPRDGEVVVAEASRVIFGRVSGALQNPATVSFELPIAVRRLTVRVRDAAVAGAIAQLQIVPRAVPPPSERLDIPVRAIVSVAGRANGYVVYTDEHVYPEEGTFWSRGTEETRVFIAPAGAARIVLTLSTGPMAGNVILSVAGRVDTVPVNAGEPKRLSFDVAPGARLVPISVQSTIMFRPADVDKTSADMRSLGCQVRISLE